MAQKFVGIDLGIHHVKVAVVQSGLRGIQVVDTFEEPVGHHDAEATEGDDDDKPSDPLSPVISVALGLLRSRGLLNEALGIALPSGLTSYRLLSFPFSDERRIAQAVNFEADGQFPTPLEELAYGHTVVPSAEGGRALVAAARRDRVEQIASIFKRAGADLKAITPGPIASAHVADIKLPHATPEMTEQGREPVALLVDLGHHVTHFVAVGAKGPLAVRTLRRGGANITQAIAARYGMDFVAAEAAKHTDAFLPHRGFESITPEQLESGKLVAEAIEDLVREIEQTRLWLRATYRWEVAQLMVVGGGVALSGLEAYLHEHTGLPVEPVRVGGPAGAKAPDDRGYATTLAAIGAAAGAARRPLVQLHDRSSADAEGSWMQERVSSLIAIGVAVMAFGALDTIAQVKAVEAEKAAYEAELEEATRKVFGAPVSAQKVAGKLAEVEGQDLTSLIPERGALEVLAMITKAATPSDLGQANAPAVGATATPGPLGADGATEDEQGETGDEDEEEEDAASASIGPIDPSSGIVMADDLTFSMIDVRERKIELKASANISSAQDRLAFKLAEIGCISKINKGKVKGDERKTFEMSMDSTCYKATTAKAEEEEPDEDSEEEED